MGTDADGTKKLRSRILLFKEDGTYAVCPDCKTPIKVPIRLDSPTDRHPKHVILAT
jgi:hypothetical protein